MNAKPIRTVFWGQWQKNRWLLLTILAGIALAYGLLAMVDTRGLRENAGDPAEDFLIAILLISVPSLVAAASVLLGHSDSERLHITLPPRILRLPLTTPKLAAVLLTFGILVAALIASAATLPAIFMLNVDFDWWVPVLIAVLAMTVLQLWRTQVDDRRDEIRLIALLRFVEQVPVTGEVARVAGQMCSRSGDGRRADEELMEAVNVAVSRDLGVPVCTRDVRTYQGHGCETVPY